MQRIGLKVFVSYSHKDEALRSALDAHLAGFVSQSIIQLWNDRSIEAGSDWNSEIQAQLDGANIILLLISADFLIELGGVPVLWDLASKSRGRTLNPRKTLRENKVPEGDTLYLCRELVAG